MDLKSKTITAIVIGFILVGLAVLIWANATGKIKIFGAVERSQATKTIRSVEDWAKGAFSGLYFKDGKLIISAELQGSEIFTDPYIGFSVTKPNGWDEIRYANGIVIVPEDGGEVLTGVFIYPIKLQQEMSLETIANKYFHDGLAGQYYNPQLSNGKIENGIYTANISAAAPNQNLTGKLIISSANNRNNAYLMKFWWAPTDQYNDKKNTLEAVAQSYQTVYEKNTQLKKQECGSFDAWSPPDWEVAGCTNNNQTMVIKKGDRAELTFGYNISGLVWLGVTQNEPGQFIEKLIDNLFVEGSSGITNVGNPYVEHLGDIQGPLGVTWKFAAREFTGTPKQGSGSILTGQESRCVITAATGQNAQLAQYNGSANNISGIVYIRCAKKDAWNEFNALMQAMEEKIQIRGNAYNPIANARLPRSNPADSSTFMGSWAYRQQVEDRLSQSWQEAIMGYEYANDGTSNYQMPLNSWQATDPSGGNSGPGYYLWQGNGWQHLNIGQL